MGTGDIVNDFSGRYNIDQLVDNIINGMYDWVRVLDRNNNIIYLNQAMSDAIGQSQIGKKCFEAVGRSTPCENCISRKAVFNGQPHEKEETIKGRVYSIMSSPIRSTKGEIFAVVEVLRDITRLKEMQQKIIEQNTKLENDLDMAKRLQCSLLPKHFHEKRIDFSYIYKPCESLGGDFFDIFKIDDDNIGIYIADVSGHGVSASMLTVFLRSAINKKTLSPSLSLRELYEEYNRNSFSHNLYITVFYAVINLKKKQITYSNAGHNVLPIVFGKSRFEPLKSSGVPISDWMKKPEYSDKSMNLQIGDRIFFYTDGIVEIRGKGTGQFGEERLFKLLSNDISKPEIVLEKIFNAACSFAGVTDAGKVTDDITMAMIEIK